GKRVAPWEAAVRDLTQVPPLWRSKHISAIRARPAPAARAADSAGRAPKRGGTMKRYAGAFTLLTVLGGCVTSDKMNPGPQPFGQVRRAQEVPNAQGPMGQPVPQYVGRSAATGGSATGVVQAGATTTSESGVQPVVMHGKDCNCPDCLAKRHGHNNGGESRMLGGHRFAGGGMNAPVPGATAAVGALPGIPMTTGAPMGAGR